MSENEDKNRNIKISQQKNTFWRNIIICIGIILIFTLIFWVLFSGSSGTQITYNEFQTQLAGGNIQEIDINQSKIEIYYVSGESHWIYNRDSVESNILSLINEMYNGELNGNTYSGTIPTIVFGKSTTVSVFSVLYPIIMIAIIIAMVVMVMRQVRGANNKSFEFVKNRARVSASKTKFTDVAGADEEKQELEDVVDFLKNPQKYVEIGAKIPKGVLLVGPPGTGKTLLARAVAGEANVPFFTISGSDFMELFVGVGASRVRDLFETAKKSKPCIIFIDEIDAVGRQRGAGLGGGNDEREQTLNQLLVQMDGFEDNEGIIVMAATNRVDILDPALLRPGRFDRRINISIPDIKGREEILKVHARNKPLDDDVNLKTIARITSGFTGAEIENLLNEAAILVAKENRKKINEEDIQKSIMKVTLGPQKRSRVIDEKDKYDTAVHESGHAIISKLAKEKSPVHEVSIIPRGGAGGYTVSTDDDATVYFREKLLCKIQMLLGGITAEKLYIGDISTGASNDLKRATEIARRMVSEWGMSSEIGMVYLGDGDELFLGRSYQERVPYSENQASIIDVEVKKIIDKCAEITEKILTENKDKLLTMAEVLMEKETIYSDEIDLILSGKSKEEVINYIDNIKNKNNENLQAENSLVNDNTQVVEQNSDKNDINFVDNLIKNAEKKENEILNSDSKKDETKEDDELENQNVSHEKKSNLKTSRESKTKNGSKKTNNSEKEEGIKDSSDRSDKIEGTVENKKSKKTSD